MSIGVTPSKGRSQPAGLDRILAAAHFDGSPAHRQPAPVAMVLASAVALGGSLLADWLIAKLAVAVFPSTRGYQHFQFGDYSTLTVLGVVAACIGWPVVVRFCSTPRWLYLRAAVVITYVAVTSLARPRPAARRRTTAP
jgi:hypothetical protein